MESNLPGLILRIALGFGLALLVALIAYRAGALNRSGSLGAVIVGGLTFGVGGIAPAFMLLAFFISSSLLSRVGAERKRSTGEKFAKGSRRDLVQVLANGSIAALLSLIVGLGESRLAMAGVAGALAAVTADTWATEIGVLARSQPRLVTTWQPVQAGTSGAVTWEGTLASLAGALLIGAIGSVSAERGLLVAGVVGGLVGSALDSLLGASVQAQYHCPVCLLQTEKHPHHGCGSPTVHVRGWPWLDNDAVNLVASAAGAGAAILLSA
jgi:uncharacterized protein (TIGR00297 family)